jgi:CO/xanthine dehydrogenase Mo-binding subunit
LFVDDINPADQYFAVTNFAVTIRSPIARGKLENIRCPAMESQYRLIRASDIPGSKLLDGSSVPILAEERLDYIGEPIAILTGPDIVKLEEISREIIVETEDADSGVPAVFSLEDNGAEIAAQVMLDIAAAVKSVSAPKEKPPDDGSSPDSSVEDAMPPEARLVTGTYRTGIQEHWYTEPHGAVAVPVGKGVAVHTASQWPDHVKRSVAAALSLSTGDVSLEIVDTGLHFDGKIWYPSLVAVHAALAAFITKQPIKLMFTREEDFRFSPKRPETMIEFSTRLEPSGEAAETEIKVRAGFGAVGFFADEMLSSIAKGAAGYYKLGHIKVSADAALTNLPPAGPFAGLGAAQGIFALERHVSKIAGVLGIENLEWRKPRFNEKKAAVDELVKLSENLMSHSDYNRKWAAYELLSRRMKTTGERSTPMRGIGISTVIYDEPPFVFGGGTPDSPRDNGKYPQLAVAIIELEVDSVDFSTNIRGVWMSVCTGALSDKRTMRRKLLQNIICALGWTIFEKLNYEGGKISESEYANYRIPEPSTIPRIHIFLSERENKEANPNALLELPYGVIPAAYLQALTQACGHHFESIPALPYDIWNALLKNEEEAEEEKEK